MPIPGSSVSADPRLRCLLLGPPKIWKTTVTLKTLPGKSRMLLCEADSALLEASRQGCDFDFERCVDVAKPYEQMTTFLAQAKEDAKAGQIQNVVVDPLSEFAERLLGQSMRLNMTQNNEEDGRRGYPHYSKRLMHCLDLLFTIPAHIVVISHFLELSNGDLGGLKKTGEGIVPLIPGSARARVAAKFNDVIWLDLDKNDAGKRRFYLSPTGAWGPGCRSLPGKFSDVEADFSKLIDLFSKEGAKPKPVAKPAVNGAAAKPPMKPVPAKPQPQAVRR